MSVNQEYDIFISYTCFGDEDLIIACFSFVRRNAIYWNSSDLVIGPSKSSSSDFFLKLLKLFLENAFENVFFFFLIASLGSSVLNY